MAYQVDWADAANDQLTELWLNAGDRMAVTQAAYNADHVIAVNPYEGEHQSEGLYRVCQRPLVVYYEIDELEQKVLVTDVLALREPSV